MSILNFFGRVIYGVKHLPSLIQAKMLERKMERDKIVEDDDFEELLEDENLEENEEETVSEKDEEVKNNHVNYNNEKKSFLSRLFDRKNKIVEDEEFAKLTGKTPAKDQIVSDELFEQLNDESDVEEKNEKENNLSSKDILDMVYDFIRPDNSVDKDSVTEINDLMDKINEMNKDAMLANVIKMSGDVADDKRCQYIIEAMENIIEGKLTLDEEETKDEAKSNVKIIREDAPAVKSATKSKITIEEPKKEEVTTKIIEEEKKSSTKSDLYNEYKEGNITAKHLVDECNKIDENNQKIYDEKCKREYDLYQKRMQEIEDLNQRISEIKGKMEEIKYYNDDLGFVDMDRVRMQQYKYQKQISELENSISILSTKVCVLEKRGFANAYVEKLEQDKEEYANFWKEELNKQEKHEEAKKNAEMFELFNDKELEVIRTSEFNSDSEKLDSVIEFKKMMRM